MKRTVSAFIILGAIIIYCFGAALIIKKENSTLVSVLDSIQECCDNNDMERAAEAAESLEKLWRKYEKRMSVFIQDSKLEELSSAVAKVRPYAEEANDELEAELLAIRYKLMLIYRAELPFWYNLL